MLKRTYGRRAVVALGGNAITRPGDSGSVEQDYHNLQESLGGVVSLLEAGYELVITHGNGPQVGNQMIRVEMAREEAPHLPLDLIGADVQGGLGYMIERVLRSKLRKRGMAHRVCCMLTMVEVDAQDPALQDPTKFVGPFFDQATAEARAADRGWVMREDRGRGWRRVVPSPEPKDIVQRQEISTLVESGTVVISCGGGGIPVTRLPNGEFKGIEGVIDKDFASASMALALGAPELFILTGVPQVLLHFGTPDECPLHIVRVEEARKYLAEGHFPSGSMGPKIDAACRFVEGGGSRTLITDVFTLQDALAGQTGTWVTA